MGLWLWLHLCQTVLFLRTLFSVPAHTGYESRVAGDWASTQEPGLDISPPSRCPATRPSYYDGKIQNILGKELCWISNLFYGWQVSQTKPNWTCKIEQIYLNKWSICQKPFAQNTDWPRSQLNKTLLEQIPIPQILITQFFHSTDLNWPKSVLNIVDWTWFCSIDHSTILRRTILIIGPSHNESKP